ncbi:hypothetical protein [Nocardia sp. CDC160]|uniref:hypothetical protein n=1 Tax=Nocardia sp. CDC160 TaxID=3112166 RepID=UPI002DC0473A|nr:hypothetical protein [Nocardia sp. CDC160]MEC3914433.1 hypothetical protein [Nocardia sp. CDC160]
MSTRRVEGPRERAVALAEPDPHSKPGVGVRNSTESDSRGRAARDSGGHAAGEKCRETDCPDCGWDVRRLEYWLRGRLLAAGAEDAQVNAEVGAHTVDVLWRKGDRVCAIEVSSAPPELARARMLTAELRNSGCSEVLWICPPGFWTAQLPAVGVDDFAADGCDYRIVGGLLASGPGGVVSSRQSAWELREFMTAWVTEQIAFGCRDEHQGGWATVTDWERHTRTQAAVIARQRQELMNQRTALALARKATRDKTKQLMRMTHRLERAEIAAQQQADDLAQTKRKIADHNRVDATLRLTVASQRAAILHWQLITWFAVLVIVTFICAGLVLK